jgi:hypothetical protein
MGLKTDVLSGLIACWPCPYVPHEAFFYLRTERGEAATSIIVVHHGVAARSSEEAWLTVEMKSLGVVKDDFVINLVFCIPCATNFMDFQLELEMGKKKYSDLKLHAE